MDDALPPAKPPDEAFPPITPDPNLAPLGPRVGVSTVEAGKRYREFPVVFLADEWDDVNLVRDVLREHEQGMFFRSALLADAMGRDDRVESALDTLILGILRLPFRFQRAKVDDDRADDALALAVELWESGALPETELYDFLRWYLVIGVGLLELEWDTSDPERWKIKSAKAWHMSHVYWREDLRVFVLQTADGQVQIDPGNGKWVLLARGQRGWMRGFVRTLPIPVLLRKLAFRDWARHSEFLGQGIVKAKTPSGAHDSDRNRYIASIKTLGTDGLIECPVDDQGNGYDAELLEAAEDHGEGFERLLTKCEKNIEVRCLGQAATTENSGPYVARGVFKSVTLDRIDGTVGPLEDALHKQAFKPLALFNLGNPNLAPRPDWDSEPPPDKLTQAQSLQSLGQFLSYLALAGYEADPGELTKRFGVTIRKSATPPASAAQAPSPPK